MPTVLRELTTWFFCSSAMAGGMFSIRVEIRLGHLFQELAGVGREALDVAALALGIEGVEDQRAFAAARKTGHDRKLPRGELHRHVLEIVLADFDETDRSRHILAQLSKT